MSNTPNQILAQRIAALEQSLVALSDYLLTHCPDDQVWEDFDPEIDGLRTQIQEEHEKSLREMAALKSPPSP